MQQQLGKEVPSDHKQFQEIVGREGARDREREPYRPSPSGRLHKAPRHPPVSSAR